MWVFAFILSISPAAERTMDVELTTQRLPLDAGGHVQNPTFSADGKQIAFEVNQLKDVVYLYIAQVKNGIIQEPTRLSLPATAFDSPNQVLANPIWHPDGVLFEGASSAGIYRLYYSNFGVPPAEFLSSDLVGGNLTHPTLSPDARKLAFISSQSGKGDVYVWSMDESGKLSPLQQTPGTESHPHFTRDGSQLLFSRKQNNELDIFKVDLDSGREELVAGGLGHQSRPIPAKDKTLFFDNSEEASRWDLASVDGSGNRGVVATHVRLPHRSQPAVSPDGEWTAYGSSIPSQNLYLKRIDGAAAVTLKTEFVACGEPAFTKSGDRVLLAFTALPNEKADWRFLAVADVTEATLSGD
jgi:Tol biopolymer transport system component